MNARSLAALGMLVALGVGAAVAGEPSPAAGTPASLRSMAAAIEREEDHVTALELAEWIRTRRPGLRVLDLRDDASFAEYHVPTAERTSLARLVDAPFRSDETLVLYSEGGGHAAQAWVLLRSRGVRRVYFLRGGLHEWMDEVMQPAASTELTRYFGGTVRQVAPSTVPMPDDTLPAARRWRRRSC